MICVNFSFFKKGSIKEILTFVSRKVVNRSALGERSSVSHEEYVAHVRVNGDKLACVVVTDKEYPSRVAHDVVAQAMKAFVETNKDWSKHTADTTISVAAIDSLVKSYQKPNEVDKIMKIQKDVRFFLFLVFVSGFCFRFFHGFFHFVFSFNRLMK